MGKSTRRFHPADLWIIIALLPPLTAAGVFYTLFALTWNTVVAAPDTLLSLGIVMGAAVAAGAAIPIAQYRRSVAPARSLSAATRGITIYTQFPLIGRSAFREIAENMNNLTARVSYLVGEITDIAGHLVASLSAMSDTSLGLSKGTQSQAAAIEEITATIEEISAGMDNVTNNVAMQFSKLAELTTNIYTLSGVITEIGEQVGNTLSLTGEISRNATDGAETLQKLSGSMDTIRLNSREMTNIVQIINDISDKINLLSLNASIEAARAGDYGRGFAVVADEISKLADLTAASIKDIDSLIKKNDREIVVELGNVSETVSMITSISNGVQRVNSMVGVISENVHKQLEIKEVITRESGVVKSGSDEIKASSQEQRIAMQEIVKSVSQINESTQSIASGSEWMANSIVELASMSQVLKEKIEYVKL